jgi:hypothetical protein
MRHDHKFHANKSDRVIIDTRLHFNNEFRKNIFLRKSSLIFIQIKDIDSNQSIVKKIII